jgi:hypothetical protein
VLTWRKLGVLIAHLPPESATMTGLRAAHPDLAEEAAEQADPAAQPWSADRMLLAALTDSVRYLAWMFAVVNFKSAPKSPPGPIPRPGVAPERRKPMTIAAYRAMTGEDPPLHLVEGAR